MTMAPLYVAFLLFMAGSIVAAGIYRHGRVCGWVCVGFVSAASLSLLSAAISVLLLGPSESVELFSLEPLVGSSLTVAVDALSALLLIMIGVNAFCSTLFSVRYVEIYRQSLFRYYPFLLFHFASLVGLVCVRDMLFFVFFWDLTSLSSWILVIYEWEDKTSLKAGLLYFIAVHATTLFVILASVLLYPYTPGPSFGFGALRTAFETLLATNPALLNAALALFFIGFITKASLLPFGFWLPLAHPVAPSSFSSVLSGVMVKLGVYAVARLFLSILPISIVSQTWGIIIGIFGALSLFVGTMAALVQIDSKRLMAFHSIGQVGYIFLGLGAGVYFLPLDPALAVVALVAGLFHMINHCWFKSCLFLNAGAVLYRTGTRNLNKVSGLLRIMPWTGITAIVAALSIGGIPPFNGFASKWMIFESTAIAGIGMRTVLWPRGLFVFEGLCAIFISAVTLASFLKFLNSAFMGPLEGVEPGAGGDVPLSMQIPQGILAFLCILFGVVPLFPVLMVYRSVSGALPAGFSPPANVLFGTWPGLSLDFGLGFVSGVYKSVWITAAFVLVFALLYFMVRSAGANTRRVEVWYGGRSHRPSAVSYKAHSFYGPFKKVFSFRLGGTDFEGLYPTSFPLPKIRMPGLLLTLLYPYTWLYVPFADKFVKFNRRFSRSHTGYLQLYMLWIAVGVIVIAVLLASGG